MYCWNDSFICCILLTSPWSTKQVVRRGFLSPSSFNKARQHVCYLSFNRVLVRFINTLNKRNKLQIKRRRPNAQRGLYLDQNARFWSIFYTIREETTRWTFGEEINSYFMGWKSHMIPLLFTSFQANSSTLYLINSTLLFPSTDYLRTPIQLFHNMMYL